jgi:hypothetical protein
MYLLAKRTKTIAFYAFLCLLITMERNLIKMNFPRVFVLLLPFLMLGCAYEAKPTSVPAFDTVTSFSNKISGKWLLYVEGSRMDAIVRARDANCSAHTFPLQGSGAFASSVRQTLANLFDRIEEVSSPPPLNEVRAKGARGVVVVRAERLDGFVQLVPG